MPRPQLRIDIYRETGRLGHSGAGGVRDFDELAERRRRQADGSLWGSTVLQRQAARAARELLRRDESTPPPRPSTFA
jgi:hypothetical protein